MVAKLTGQTSALSSGTRLEQDEHTRPHLTQLSNPSGANPMKIREANQHNLQRLPMALKVWQQSDANASRKLVSGN
jgi:hypothetical protein